jgi:replicative DNA helicase
VNFPELDLVVLKSIINNKKNAIDFVNQCDAKLFSPSTWNFANAILGYVKTYKEVPTLRVVEERLSKGSNEKLIESIKKTWAAIDSISYNEKEYKHDLEKLKKRFAEQQILNIKESLAKLEPGKMDISKVLGEMQKTSQSIKNINTAKSFESKTVKEHLPQFVEVFKARKENPELEIGLKTKYSWLDFATNGLKPADFLLIAGESGFGKSLFLNNIAVQTWMQNNSITDTENFLPGKNIIYFSLEMPYEDCFNRFLSRLSGVPSRNIENSKLNKEELAKVRLAIDFIKNYPYQFRIVDIADACANDIDNILGECEEAGENFEAVFVDYLGIMKTNEPSNEDDWLKQGQIAYETRAIARKRLLPMFSAVQLNRKGQKKDPAESIGLSRLARSGTIATHATHVIQIENRPNEENYPDFLYHIIKNRKGPKGKGVLIKNLACATLIDKPSEENNYDNYFVDQDDISAELEELEDFEI